MPIMQRRRMMDDTDDPSGLSQYVLWETKSCVHHANFLVLTTGDTSSPRQLATTIASSRLIGRMSISVSSRIIRIMITNSSTFS